MEIMPCKYGVLDTEVESNVVLMENITTKTILLKFELSLQT